MTPSEILKSLLINLQTNARQLSRDIGLKSPQIFYNIRKDINGFSPNLSRRICEHFPQINYEWLLSGRGMVTHSAEKGIDKKIKNDIQPGHCLICQEKEKLIGDLKCHIEELKINFEIVLQAKEEIINLQKAHIEKIESRPDAKDMKKRATG